MFRKLTLAASSALLLGTAQPGAPFTIVETGEAFASLQDAVDAIHGGTGTIRIAAGRYGECAVQEAGRIAFVAEAPGTAIFEGGVCEGKATLVLRGQAAHVEGLVFTGTFVDDGNGAGIRIEQGDLSVAWTRFDAAQSGILSASDPRGRIAIDHSTFSRLGIHPDGNGAHSVYIGAYGSLTITNSRFERGTGGHYVKSRAPLIDVRGTSFDDSQGQTTNYLIDLPNGAAGRIAGNHFLQGTGKENYTTMIAIAAEGAERSSARLVIEDNDARVAPGFRWTTAFVGDWAGEPPVIRNNRVAAGIVEYQTR